MNPVLWLSRININIKASDQEKKKYNQWYKDLNSESVERIKQKISMPPSHDLIKIEISSPI